MTRNDLVKKWQKRIDEIRTELPFTTDPILNQFNHKIVNAKLEIYKEILQDLLYLNKVSVEKIELPKEIKAEIAAASKYNRIEPKKEKLMDLMRDLKEDE